MQFWPSKANILADVTKMQNLFFVSRSLGLVKVVEHSTMKRISKIISQDVSIESVPLKLTEYKKKVNTLDKALKIAAF